MIYEFLFENGTSRDLDIYEYIKEFRQNTSLETLRAALYFNRDIFNKKGIGIWDIVKGNLNERKERLIRKLVIVNDFYQKKIKELNGNGDIRRAGISFNIEEEDLMREIYNKYKR